MAALKRAMAATMPFVIDVNIDPTVPVPMENRIKSLIAQSAG